MASLTSSHNSYITTIYIYIYSNNRSLPPKIATRRNLKSEPCVNTLPPHHRHQAFPETDLQTHSDFVSDHISQFTTYALATTTITTTSYRQLRIIGNRWERMQPVVKRTNREEELAKWVGWVDDNAKETRKEREREGSLRFKWHRAAHNGADCRN